MRFESRGVTTCWHEGLALLDQGADESYLLEVAAGG